MSTSPDKSREKPFAALGVGMNIYWRLQNLALEPERWELHVGYTPLFKSQLLQNRFQPAEWRIAFPDTPGLLGRLVALVEETRPHLPDRPDIVDGELVFKVEGALRHIGQYPMSSLPHMRPENVFWSRPNLVGGQEIPGNTKGYVPIASFSEAARSAVWDVAGHTVGECYRHFEARLREATDIPEVQQLPRPRIRAFIAYRSVQRPLAERVHAALAASHVLFDPYLDRHDLQLGDWRKQIFEAIAQTDVFVPVVTEDYAEKGTFCEEEYLEAKRLAGSRGIEDFFAPIFVNPKGTVGEELLRLQGLKVDDIGVLDAQPKWGIFERQMISVAMRHGI